MKYKYLKNKKFIAAIIAAAVFLSAGGFAASRLVEAATFDEARETAREKVPASAELINEDKDDDDYRFEFYNQDNNEKFTVIVDRDDNSEMQIRSKLDNREGSEEIVLDKNAVINIVRSQYPGAQISSVSLSEDDGMYLYEIVFSAEDVRGQFFVNPETGIIVERILSFGQPILVMNFDDDKDSSDYDDDDDSVIPQGSEYITLAAARVIALEEYPGAYLKELKYDEDDDRLVIEVTLSDDGSSIELTIDAVTGQIIDAYHDDDDDDDNDDYDDNGYDDNDDDRSDDDQQPQPTASETTETQQNSNDPVLIGMDRAKEIVLAKIPGAEFTELELDYDDGRTYYEGYAFLNGYEYEFEIDAYTGVIVEWDVENNDDYDDDDYDDDSDEDYEDEDDSDDDYEDDYEDDDDDEDNDD